MNHTLGKSSYGCSRKYSYKLETNTFSVEISVAKKLYVANSAVLMYRYRISTVTIQATKISEFCAPCTNKCGKENNMTSFSKCNGELLMTMSDYLFNNMVV